MVHYKDYQPKNTSRKRETIEWLMTYIYNTNDEESPRILLIGDSICNMYHGYVRDLLSERANISYLASSRCVTDPEHFRELDMILERGSYDIISYNNGLHSLTSDADEWEYAYNSAVSFIQDKCPDSKLFLTLCTAVRDEKKNALADVLNQRAIRIAKEKRLSLIDLFTPMNQLDLCSCMNDTYHYKVEAVEMQANIIVSQIEPYISNGKVIKQYATDMGPAGRLG